MVKPELLAFDDDDDSDKDEAASNNDDDNKNNNLVINKRYAKDFQLRKQREDLRKHFIDHDDHASSSSDDDNEEEDEEGDLLTTKLDVDILKTIHALRSKDARIYNPAVRFFDTSAAGSDNDEDAVTSETKHKPKRYKDVVREQALEQIEKEGSDHDDDDDVNENGSYYDGRKSHHLAYDREQEDIRKSFLQSTQDLVDDNSDDSDSNENNGGLLVVKKRDLQQQQQQHEEEKEFAAEIQRIESTLQDTSSSEYVDPRGEVDDGSKFLLNYFKNRSWIDKDQMDDDDGSDNDDNGDWQTKLGQQRRRDTGGHVDEALPMKADDNDGHESDTSLNQLDKTDDFEAQYNFRFEEAAGTQSGADFSLVSYARGQTVDTLRRRDETRREKRLARKERKAAERKAKEEELKRLKNLKRKEMERKLGQVKKVVGLTEEDADLDEAAILKLIEGDYDPDDFEKKMQETFGDDFYSKEDKEWKSDKDVRETLLKDDDGKLLVGDDNEGDMYDAVAEDAEDTHGDVEENEEDGWDEQEYYEGDGDEEATEETQLEKKIRAKMDDELYKLDYEDIVAGMPTRFKYRQVEPNAYGLTTEEILFARDTTLKQFVSLKKMAPYREEGEHHVGGKRRYKFREQLKQEIEEEMGEENDKQIDANKADEPQETKADEPQTSSKKRKRRKSKKSKSAENDESEKIREETTQTEEPSKAVDASENEDKTAHADIDKSSAEPKRKRRRRQKKKKSVSTEDESNFPEPDQENKQETLKPTSDTIAIEKEEKTENEPYETTSASQELSVEKAPSTEEAKNTPENSEKKKEKKRKKEKKGERKREKKKAKKSAIEGISTSRLSSYGL